VDQLDLGSRDHSNLDDPDCEDEHKRHDECELDDSTPAFSRGHTPSANEMIFCITVLKNDGNISVVDAHVMRAIATMAAATSTRAYSAVA
jgi:hypothetical protein